jgi:hypothetical protein
MGAAIHDSAPIGRAAAAQTASVFRTEYCGISTETGASGFEGVSSPLMGSAMCARILSRWPG